MINCGVIIESEQTEHLNIFKIALLAEYSINYIIILITDKGRTVITFFQTKQAISDLTGGRVRY